MCDPFCKHPAFLARAILTLVGSVGCLCMERSVSLWLPSFQVLSQHYRVWP